MYCFVLRSIYFTSKKVISVCETILYIHKSINNSACEKDLEVLQIASEKFSKGIMKQIKKMSENEKDFVLLKIFDLLMQTYPASNWSSTTSSEEEKHLESIFERVIIDD